MIDRDGNVNRVTAFVCNLTSEYGDNPTEAQAESFARRERTIITPQEAIKVLGVGKWSDVIAFYQNTILKTGPRVIIQKEKKKKYARTYTYEELVDELVAISQDLGGEITQRKLNDRAREKPTPSWITLRKRLGEPDGWGAIIDRRLAQEKPQNNHKI